jgi:hypothetical protein
MKIGQGVQEKMRKVFAAKFYPPPRWLRSGAKKRGCMRVNIGAVVSVEARKSLVEIFEKKKKELLLDSLFALSLTQ